MRLALALLTFCPLTGCIWTPNNHSPAESEAPISLSGFATKGETVTFSVRNYSTGGWDFLGKATASQTPAFFSSDMYPWSFSHPAVAKSYWVPQVAWLNGLSTSDGRLEIQGVGSGGAPLVTFNSAASQCVLDKMDAGVSAPSAGQQCTDGTTLVEIDKSGVGTPAQTGVWTPVYTAPTEIVNGVPVDLQVVTYKSQGLDVYGLVCMPHGSTNLPAMIVNHGGYGGLDSWFSASYCKTAASHNWFTAMSAYRGEPVQLVVNGTLKTWASSGNVEFCLGEVLDVVRLTEIVRARSEVNSSRVIMWGHSHGGCITTRAVERGALVVAAASFSGPMDIASWHDFCASNPAGCSAFGVECLLGPGVTAWPEEACKIGTHPMPTSIAAGSQAYTWRSSTTFPDDLQARTDVKMLFLASTGDNTVPPAQGCRIANTTSGSLVSTNWFVTSNNTQEAPDDCKAQTPSLTWTTAPIPSGSPGSWTPQRSLIVYDDPALGHDRIACNGPICGGMSAAWLDFARFVESSSFPPP